MSLSARCRSAGLAVTLVLALLGAPASSAWRNACDLCPPSCPMHQHREDAAAKAAPHMKCHGAPAGSALQKKHEQRRSAAGRGPSVTRPPCGNHGAITASVLPPMILPRPAPRLVAAGAERAPLAAAASHRRNADPPDTPPPIVAA